MAITTRTFTTLVQSQAAAMQARARKLLDFSIGAIMRAIIEGNAAVALWLQAELVKLLAVTRAATSTGADLDSYVNDFGLTRLGAQTSIGSVTFSRFTASAQAVIPLGTIVANGDNSQQFIVTLDPLNSAYNAGLGGYVLPAGVMSLSVPVQAVTPGTGANVLAAAISVIVGAIPFVDNVTNAAALAGGSEAETDEALRLRFVRYLQSLSKATPAAVAFAVSSLRLGIQHTLTEHYAFDGTYRPGYFYVVVDDGTGAPPDSLVTDALAAIEAVRGATIMFGVHKPLTTTAAVTMTLTVAPGYDANVVKGTVGTVVRDWIEALPLGDGLPYSKLAQVAYEASAGVLNVTGLLLNGNTVDLPADKRVRILPGTIAVN